jgi:hypothetical protein
MSERDAPGPAASAPEPRSPNILRPYILTQGRTGGPGARFPLEAQVQAHQRDNTLDPSTSPEARAIVTLSQQPVSIAEIAARLHWPVGVIRVLVADLAAAEIVAVSNASDGVAAAAAADATVLERLRDGVRAL